jgi:hypothetical protein
VRIRKVSLSDCWSEGASVPVAFHLGGFGDQAVRRIMHDNCAELLGSGR